MPGSISEQRDAQLWFMCRASVCVIVLSVGCVVVGSLAIAQSAPKYKFPYCLGGAMIAGMCSLLSAACQLKLYANNKLTYQDSANVRSWLVKMAVVVVPMTGIALGVGIGVSGIWSIVQATDAIGFQDKFKNIPSPYDVPYAEANLKYGIATLVLLIVLTIVQCSAWSSCLMYTDTYEFGNTHYSYQGNRRSYIHRDSRRTNQHRPRQPSADVHIPAHALHLSSTIDYNHGISDHVSLPSAPAMPVTVAGQPSYRQSFNDSDISQIATDSIPTDVQPPPAYDDLEEPPPTYSRVIIEGAFKVHYV